MEEEEAAAAAAEAAARTTLFSSSRDYSPFPFAADRQKRIKDGIRSVSVGGRLRGSRKEGNKASSDGDHPSITPPVPPSIAISSFCFGCNTRPRPSVRPSFSPP